MAHPLYDASVPTFLHFLQALSKLIDKAAESGIAESQILEAKLLEYLLSQATITESAT